MADLNWSDIEYTSRAGVARALGPIYSSALGLHILSGISIEGDVL